MKSTVIKCAAWICGIALSVYLASGDLAWLPHWVAMPVTLLFGTVGLIADPDVSRQVRVDVSSR
jgi:hypothetical protein